MKKLLTLFACMLVAFTGNAQSTQKGDINGDGDISVNDVAMIVNYILGIIDSNFIIANADINGDGEIDINDVMGTVSIILEDDIPDIELSATTLNMTIRPSIDCKKTVYIMSGSGSYTVKSSNLNVVTALIEDSEIIITAKNKGEATIRVTDTKSGETATIQVIVFQAYLTCPNENHPHIIDLGLPSGTKWACCNVDDDSSKQSPTNYGSYYAFGEVSEKDVYNEVTYQYMTGVDWDGDGWYDRNWSFQDLGSDIAGTQYDVAHVQWGGSWVMPNFYQNKELLENCNNEWTTVNGVNGRKFTSKTNGGSIFLPAAGYRDHSGLRGAGSYGSYWSSNRDPFEDLPPEAYGLSFESGGLVYSQFSFLRENGHTVRPVWVEE